MGWRALAPRAAHTDNRGSNEQKAAAKPKAVPFFSCLASKELVADMYVRQNPPSPRHFKKKKIHIRKHIELDLLFKKFPK